MSAPSRAAAGNGRTVLLNGSYAPSLLNFRGRFIAAMVAAGHEVHVSAPGIDPALRTRLECLGAAAHDVPLSRAGLDPFADLRYYRAIRDLALRLNADLVVNYTIKPNIWGSLAARSAGVRSASLVTGLGYAFISGKGLKRGLVQRISRALYRLATKANEVVIFQNPDDRDDFLAAGCLAEPAKARMIAGSGVDLDRFRPQPLPEKPVFLMAARLLVNKGAREFGEAALQVLGRRDDCRFLIAGYVDEGPDGVDPAEIARWEAGGVELLGHVEDIRPCIASASVFVLPSYREGTPRSVLEAMAMERPVVTTDVPGCRETVVDGENGLLVPPRDAGALAAAMERLADDPALRRLMGKRGREICERKYDVDRVNADLLGHLSLGLESRSAP